MEAFDARRYLFEVFSLFRCAGQDRSSRAVAAFVRLQWAQLRPGLR